VLNSKYVLLKTFWSANEGTSAAAQKFADGVAIWNKKQEMKTECQEKSCWTLQTFLIFCNLSYVKFHTVHVPWLLHIWY